MKSGVLFLILFFSLINLSQPNSTLFLQETSGEIAIDVTQPVEFINNTFLWEPIYKNGIIESVDVSLDLTFYEEIEYFPILVLIDENRTIVDLNNFSWYTETYFLFSENYFASKIGKTTIEGTILGEEVYTTHLQENMNVIIGVFTYLDEESTSFYHSDVVFELQLDYTDFVKPYLTTDHSSLSLTYLNKDANTVAVDCGCIDSINLKYTISVHQSIRALMYDVLYLVNQDNVSDVVDFDSFEYSYPSKNYTENTTIEYDAIFSFLDLELTENGNYSLIVMINFHYYIDNQSDQDISYRELFIDDSVFNNNSFTITPVETKFTGESIILSEGKAEWIDYSLLLNTSIEMNITQVSISSSGGIETSKIDFWLHEQINDISIKQGTSIDMSIPMFHPYFGQDIDHRLEIHFSLEYEKAGSYFRSRIYLELDVDLTDINIVDAIISDLSITYEPGDLGIEGEGFDYLEVNGTFNWNKDTDEFDRLNFIYGYGILHPEFGLFTSGYHFGPDLSTNLVTGSNFFEFYFSGESLTFIREENDFVDYTGSQILLTFGVVIYPSDYELIYIKFYENTSLSIDDFNPNSSEIPETVTGSDETTNSEGISTSTTTLIDPTYPAFIPLSNLSMLSVFILAGIRLIKNKTKPTFKNY